MRLAGNIMARTIYPECVVPVRWHINGPTASAHPSWGRLLLLADKSEFNGIGGLRSYNRDRANCGTLPYLNFGFSSPPSWGRFFSRGRPR